MTNEEFMEKWPNLAAAGEAIGALYRMCAEDEAELNAASEMSDDDAKRWISTVDALLTDLRNALNNTNGDD